MQLYVFACDNWRNIKIGYEKHLWAVSKRDDQTNKSRWGKARQMPPYSRGILYCSETQSFVMPFVTRCYPQNEVVPDIWPEEWMFPFEIVPLGSPSLSVHLDAAKREWPILQTNSNPTHCLNGMAGRTIFVPNEITPEDWHLILQHLAENSDDRFPPPQPAFDANLQDILLSKNLWPLPMKFTASGWKALQAEEAALEGCQL